LRADLRAELISGRSKAVRDEWRFVKQINGGSIALFSLKMYIKGLAIVSSNQHSDQEPFWGCFLGFPLGRSVDVSSRHVAVCITHWPRPYVQPRLIQLVIFCRSQSGEDLFANQTVIAYPNGSQVYWYIF